MTMASVGQRVHNVFHHLEDGSLPYDLWDDDAELAALVYLLKKNPEESATNRFFGAVRAYVESNRRVGVAVRPFDEARTRVRIGNLSRFVEQFPQSTSAATIYMAALENSAGSLQ